MQMIEGSTVSPSQLRVYDNCPQEHFYSYVEKIQKKERTSKPHFDFGNYAHELMHVYYGTMKATGQKPGSDFLIKMMESRVKNDLLQADFENIELVSLVWPRLLQFFTYQSPKIDKGITVQEVEHEFKVKVVTFNGHTIILHGVIDLIYIDPSGTIRIRDHKTGQRANTHNANSVMLDDQLGHYGISLDIPDVEISFINSYLHKKSQPPLDTLFGHHRYRHTPVGMSLIKSNIIEKVDKIFDNKPHKNYSPACPNCQFFELCHAETRGINVEKIKSLHYRTKVEHDPSNVRLSVKTEKTSEHADGNAKFEISFDNL